MRMASNAGGDIRRLRLLAPRGAAAVRPCEASPRMLCLEPVLLGDIAQLGERVLCKHEVVGSIPSVSTIFLELGAADAATVRTLVSRPAIWNMSLPRQ